MSLDFESYGEAGYIWHELKQKWGPLTPKKKGGLALVGAAAYAAHPKTEALMFSFGPITQEWVDSWLPGMPPPEKLIQHILAGGIVSGQKVMFEFWLWNWYMHRRLGWPALPISQLIDTAALCRAYGVPGRLELAGKVLLPEHLQKTAKEGKLLITKLSIPKNPTKKEPNRRRILMADAPLDAAKFLMYNKQDVVAERSLLRICPPLLPEETRMWQLDAEINDRGVHVDYEGMRRCIDWTNYHTLVGNAELHKITGDFPVPGGRVSAASELKKTGIWLEGQGLKIGRTPKNDYALDDDATTALLRLPLAPHIHRVVELRQNLAGAAVKKLFAMERVLSPGNRLRGMFEFHGAHTGRWAGRLVQLHNNPPSLEPPKGVDYDLHIDNVIHNTEMSMPDVKGCLRGLLTAAPGNILISSDYNAIEAVVAAVLANEEWRLEVFRTHGKIYETSASKITGTPFSEFMDHKKRTGKHHPERNKLGKYAELASGFGGWINAWKNFGADEHLSDRQIRDAVLAWRAASPNIVETWGGQWREVAKYEFKPEWYGLEGAFVQAMHTPDIRVQVGEFLSYQYYAAEDVMRLHTPSGRCLVYQRPRLQPGRDNFSKKPQWSLSYLGFKKGQLQRVGVYGGLLFENAVQFVARDILRDAMIRLDDNGYPVVIHVHDEPTAEVPTGFGSVEEFERIIKTRSGWCHNWPINASGGWRGRRYRK